MQEIDVCCIWPNRTPTRSSKAMEAIADPDVAARRRNVVCVSACAGTVMVVRRDVAISDESVIEETVTCAGKGVLLRTVTGMVAVSETMVTASDGVSAMLFITMPES